MDVLFAKNSLPCNFCTPFYLVSAQYPELILGSCRRTCTSLDVGSFRLTTGFEAHVRHFKFITVFAKYPVLIVGSLSGLMYTGTLSSCRIDVRFITRDLYRRRYDDRLSIIIR